MREDEGGALKVSFAYFKALSYSGQSAASELIVSELKKRGWECPVIPIYPLERGVGGPIKAYGIFLVKQVATLFRFTGLLFLKKPLLHFNLGQGFGTFFRVGAPYVLVRMLKPSMRVVISLHGSVFMEWEKTVLVTRVFLAFLRSANAITVLGEQQKRKLIDLGIDAGKVRVLPNTCDLSALTLSEAESKQVGVEELVFLHLSLLIESKGFPVFLEALELLASRDLVLPVRGILCGPMAATVYCGELSNAKEKEKWINDKVQSINTATHGKVRVDWIRGASGKIKLDLFRGAHVFVFPSTFPVEAQPLVLLEAMASGCALVTSSVGEIPSTLEGVDASILENITALSLSEEMFALIADENSRIKMANSGVKAMNGKYSIRQHVDQWESVFRDLAE